MDNFPATELSCLTLVFVKVECTTRTWNDRVGHAHIRTGMHNIQIDYLSGSRYAPLRGLGIINQAKLAKRTNRLPFHVVNE
jgi:hypothetical protein